MASLQDIRRRIKSVKSTQQITKAMKMVAAARKLDLEAMRKVVAEHSNNLLDYVKSMPKQYPHFFM